MADITISGLDSAISVNTSDVLPISNGSQTLKATVSQIRGSSGAITGSIIMWPTETPPAGYLECNGAAISRTGYAALFSALGTRYGVGDNSTTFNLPDLRGRFVRGWDHGAGADPDSSARTNRGDGTTGDNIGTKQTDELKSHNHQYNYKTTTYAAPLGSYFPAWYSDIATNTTSTGGNETRPTNIYLMYCIKT